MATYVYLYQGGGMPETKEQQDAVMAAWGAWYGELGDAVIDGGNPFGASREVAADGTSSGQARSNLSGYTIVSADSLDAAAKMAAGCPVLTDGGRVEVYETFDVSQPA